MQKYLLVNQSRCAAIGWSISLTSAPHLFCVMLDDCSTCSSVLIELEEKGTGLVDSLQDDEIISVVDNFWRVTPVYSLKPGMLKPVFPYYILSFCVCRYAFAFPCSFKKAI